MSVVISIFAVVVACFLALFVRHAIKMSQLVSRGQKLAHTIAKISGSIDMFRSNIPADRLQKGANKYDLYYYLGYITELAKVMAEYDGFTGDGAVLAPVQIEASRLFGESQSENGDYAEGINILPGILKTRSAEIGRGEGHLDASYVVNPQNPGPYFDHLRTYFGVVL